MSIAEYVHKQVEALLDQVVHEAERASADASDEAIHDLRVAIRRLSESLRVFEQLFPRGGARKVRREIKVAMRLAGEVRNHDIASALMQKAHLTVGPEMDEGRRKAALQLVGVLSDWSQSRTARAWRQRLFHGKSKHKKPPAPHTWQPAASVEQNAKLVLSAMARDYFAAGRNMLAEKHEPAALHPFRLATKRFRYTLEMFRDVYGESLSQKLDLLKPVQQNLGEVNDCVASVVAFRAGRIFRGYLERRAALKSRAFGRAWRTKFDQPGQEDIWIEYLSTVPETSSQIQTAVHSQYLASYELRGT